MGRLALAPISRLGIEALAARIVHAAATAKQLALFRSRRSNTRLRSRPGENDHRTSSAKCDPARRPGASSSLCTNRRLEQRARSPICRCSCAWRPKRPRKPIIASRACLLFCWASPSNPRLTSGCSPRWCSIRRTCWRTATTGDDAIQSLERILGVTAENIDTTPPTATLDRVRTWLFSSDPPPSAPARSCAALLCPGESFECVEIARRIRALAAQGTPFDRIAILLRNVDPYQPLVEEALRRAGIGHYFSRGAARPDPAGRAFLALLACASEGCSASRFAEYLSLGQTPTAPFRWLAGIAPAAMGRPRTMRSLRLFRHPGFARAYSGATDAPPLDVPIGWEKLLVDAAVIGGRDRWARRLRGLRAELQAQLRDMEEEDDSHRAHIRMRIQQLERLEHFALPLIEVLGSLPSSERWGVWLDRLTELAQMALRRPESVLSVLSELEPMREVGPASLDEVY